MSPPSQQGFARLLGVADAAVLHIGKMRQQQARGRLMGLPSSALTQTVAAVPLTSKMSASASTRPFSVKPPQVRLVLRMIVRSPRRVLPHRHRRAASRLTAGWRSACGFRRKVSYRPGEAPGPTASWRRWPATSRAELAHTSPATARACGSAACYRTSGARQPLESAANKCARAERGRGAGKGRARRARRPATTGRKPCRNSSWRSCPVARGSPRSWL